MAVADRVRRMISTRYKRHGVYSASLDRLNRLPLHADYLRQHDGVPSFPTRERMWEAVAARCPGPIDFLEFGVHEGHSILYWAAQKRERDSRFVGFDTFTGLPETWNARYPAGHFDTRGLTPPTIDRRVSFVAGLFQETLAHFLASYDRAGRQVVVHIDCDLYASALFCLTRIDPLLVAGSLLIFDEFGDVLHEFRAFTDYLASYRRQARLICTHDEGFTAALEMQ